MNLVTLRRIGAPLALALTTGAFAQQPPPDPAQHEARLKAWFARVDINHDGVISRDEAQAGAPRLAALFDAIDTDHDGTLSPDELKAFHARMHDAGMQAARLHAQAIFKTLDVNGDGVITREEAARAPHRELAEHFDQIDTDHDGSLSLDEFTAAMQAHAHRHHGEP